MDQDLYMPQSAGGSGMIEYVSSPNGALSPSKSYNMSGFKEGSGGMGPIRRVGMYELPRWQYLPWQPWMRVPGMPTEMPDELKIPPNIPRDSKEFQDWLAARGEWERYLGGPIQGGPADTGSRKQQIMQWEVEQELKREAELSKQAERQAREDRAKENIRRKIKGLPTIEEEEKAAKEEQRRKDMLERFRQIKSDMERIRQEHSTVSTKSPISKRSTRIEYGTSTQPGMYQTTRTTSTFA